MTSAIEAAGYVRAAENLSVTEAKRLQKLLYFAQAWHLAWTGKALFNEDFEAWTNGPVVRSVYRDNRFYDLPDGSSLSPESKEIIDSVLEYYRPFSVNELIDLTHEDAPWKEARAGLSPHATSQRVLNNKTIVDYYTALSLQGKSVPRRRAHPVSVDPNEVSEISMRALDRWRKGLELLAQK